MPNNQLKFETLALHAGHNIDPTLSRAVPIYRTSSYIFKSAEHAVNLFALKELGYTPKFDSSEDIVFSDKKNNYYINMQDTEGFFHLVYPAFWPIKNVAEMNKALSACNDINSVVSKLNVFDVFA